MTTTTAATAATAPVRPLDELPVRARTLRGLLLATELDTARQAGGHTTRGLAAQMSMSPAMLNRVMTGRRTPTALEIGGLCALLDIHPARRRDLYRMAAEVDHLNWLRPHPPNPDADPGPGPHDLVAATEALADSTTTHDPIRIPAALRTPDYHHSLRDPTPLPTRKPDTTYVIHERALVDPTVPEEVMTAQRRHLSTRHDTRVRVVPGTAPPTPPIPFRLLTIANFHPIVHLELNTTTLLLEGPDATTPYTAALALLLAHSVPAAHLP